uniref:Translocation protein SEC62 n=1 Tax=Gasterosteus aculeatus aculeatus TaxID=481459 RepID=G3PXU4_GASAC
VAQTPEVSEPTKEEKAVAKYLRFNCPTKSTNMVGHRVDYFIASKAVDCLLDSKWAKAKKGEEAVFTTRESVVDYCNRLLKKQFFHRALKVMKKKNEKDAKKEKEKEKTKADSGKEEEKKGKKDKEKKKEPEAAETKKEKSDDSPGTPKKKKKEVKKKFKLELHEEHEQLFLDGNEVFVWIYDPVHFKTFAMGLILVIAVIAATLFPLWPAEMRVGVYYLSVAAGCFVASILLLAVARCILFLIIWVVTGGRHHFWFLPNLTADVGFIDSFRPLYTHDYKGPRGGNKKGSDKTDEKDNDGNKAQKSDSEEKSDSEKKDEAEGEATGRHSDTDSDRREDEGSQHSNGNDFEMITREELEQHTEEEEEEEEEEEGDEEEEEEEESQSQERKKGGESETKPQTAET